VDVERRKDQDKELYQLYSTEKTAESKQAGDKFSKIFVFELHNNQGKLIKGAKEVKVVL
jgi:hypothetical protein